MNNKQYKWLSRLIRLNRIHKKSTCNFDREKKTIHIFFSEIDAYESFTKEFIEEMEHRSALIKEKGIGRFEINVK